VKYNWNWGILWQTSADGHTTWIMTLIHGLGWTLLTALCAGVIALLLGSIIGVIRTTPSKWAVRFGNAYVELFRNIPLLVQLFLWYFVLPEVVPKALGDLLKSMAPPWGSFVPAVIGLGSSPRRASPSRCAPASRRCRAGRGWPAPALGLTLPQSYRYVLLPMAFRIVMPPLTSETMNLIKNTSVALTIGLVELTAAGRSMQEYTFQVFEAFTAATVIYIIVNLTVVNLMRWFEKRIACPGFIGPRSPAGRTDMEAFDWNVIIRSFVYLFKEGMTFTLTLTGLAAVGGIVFGTLLAMMRLSSFKWLSLAATGYVNLMRSIPLLLVIFWFYFLVPYIGAWMTGASRPIQVGAIASSVITFTMFEAAYYSEIMRAGIQSIPRGQVWAGYALGLDYWQTMAKIVLPQAFRNMLPILLTQTIILFQDTSLVYVLSITDFLGAASKVAQRDGRLVEMYLFAALVYFVVSFGLSLLVKRLQQKIAIVR
jgi:glutamate/aspartate transport system permease protein